MNDPINPWLDSAHVRQLAEQLMQPAHTVCTKNEPDLIFEVYSNPPTSQQEAVAKPQAASQTQPTPTPKSGVKLHTIIEQIVTQTGATDTVVVSAKGETLYAQHESARYRFVAKQLAQKKSSSKPVGLNLGPSAYLQLIPIDLETERIVFSARFTEALSSEAVTAINQALSQATF